MNIITKNSRYKHKGHNYKIKKLSLENETDLIGRPFSHKGKDYTIDKYILFSDGSIWVALKDNHILGWQTYVI